MSGRGKCTASGKGCRDKSTRLREGASLCLVRWIRKGFELPPGQIAGLVDIPQDLVTRHDPQHETVPAAEAAFHLTAELVDAAAQVLPVFKLHDLAPLDIPLGVKHA